MENPPERRAEKLAHTHQCHEHSIAREIREPRAALPAIF